MFAAIIILTLIFLFVGVPIAFLLGFLSISHFSFIGNTPLIMIGQRLYSGTDEFVLLAIPFFILAGDLMNKTKITDDLISLMRVIVGRIPGALAQVNILSSIFFAGLTGSAVADTSAIGSVLIPSMKKEGYSAEYAAAVTTTSSIIGPIIPPSIIMVIYSTVSMQSVGALFAAGFAPGLLIGLGLMIVAFIYAIKENHPRRTERVSIKEFLQVLKRSIIALIAPLILVGGILGGMFTPTEAAAVACIYALFVGIVLFRNIKSKDIIDSLISTAITSGSILLIISFAKLFATILVLEKIPQSISEFMISVSSNKYIFLLLVNLLLLFIGMILETGASVILLAPILLPVAIGYGVNPLHFALVMLVNLNIGLTTPPVGVCLFTAAPIAKVPVERIALKAMPFIGVEILVLFLITYVPDIILFVPRLLGFV